MSNRRSLDEILFHLRKIARVSGDKWERDFSRSILRHSKRPEWKPTAKQQFIMQRMVSELFSLSGVSADTNIDLIDEGDRPNAA